MFIHQRIIAFFFAMTLVACGHQCLAQRWLSMDRGFACLYAGPTAYELTIDNNNDRLFISGVLAENGYCEEWRTPGYWDGTEWQRVGVSTPSIYFLTTGYFHDTLFAANPIYGDDYSNFLKWNGEVWDTIPGGPKSFGMYHMLEHEDYLYVSGAFQECAGVSANLVFRYDGNTVEPLVDYFNDVAFGQTIAFYNDSLFVGGYYYNNEDQVFHLGSVYNKKIHPVGQGLNSDCNVEALCVHDGVLWIGGYFGPGNFDPVKYYHLAYYDGYSIKPSPWQPDGRVTALKSYNNELYMAGWFAHIEDKESHCVAKINDFGYYSLNPDTVYNQYGLPASYGINIVKDMEIWHDTLYLAGSFGSIGSDTALNCIAKLNRALTPGKVPLSENIVLYPNPTTGDFVLKASAYFNQSASVHLHDATGRHIFTEQWPLGERIKVIDSTYLANGVYIVTIETSSGLWVRRLVKE